MEVSLDGERLSAAEVRDLLKGADGLQLIRGRWVEVDDKMTGSGPPASRTTRLSCARLLFTLSVTSDWTAAKAGGENPLMSQNRPVGAGSGEICAKFFTSDAASHGPRAPANYNEP
jgi:hypothetical protein